MRSCKSSWILFTFQAVVCVNLVAVLLYSLYIFYYFIMAPYITKVGECGLTLIRVRIRSRKTQILS